MFVGTNGKFPIPPHIGWGMCSSLFVDFVCVEVLRPSQPNGVMSSAVSLLTTRLQGRLSPLRG